MACVLFCLFILVISSAITDTIPSVRRKRQTNLSEADSTCCDGSNALAVALGCISVGSTCYCNENYRDSLPDCWADLETYEADPACCYFSTSEFFEARAYCSYNTSGVCECEDVDDISYCKATFFTALSACCSHNEDYNHNLYSQVQAYCYLVDSDCRCSDRDETESCKNTTADDTTTETTTTTTTTTTTVTTETESVTTTSADTTETDSVTTTSADTTETDSVTTTSADTTETDSVTTASADTTTTTATTATSDTSTAASSSVFVAVSGCCDATVIAAMNLDIGDKCSSIESLGICVCADDTDTQICKQST